MATTTREKLFWLGCGVFIIVAVKGISWQLREAERLSRVAADKVQKADEQPHSGEEDENKKQGTEDDISLETLAVLIDHPNYDIRLAARKIVLNRFANDAECCMQLSKDLFKPDVQTEAAAVLNELFNVADRDSLIRRPYSGDSPDSSNTIDGILRAAAQGRAGRSDRTGPVVTLEEVGGDNGEVISLRLEGTGSAPSFRPTSPEREESPEELALRRWRRREAMIVEVDGDGGIAELRQPL